MQSNSNPDMPDVLTRTLMRQIEEQRRLCNLLERLVEAQERTNAPTRETEDVVVGVRAICELLGVSENTLRQMTHESDVPLFKLPGDNRWRVSRLALDRWIKRQAKR